MKISISNVEGWQIIITQPNTVVKLALHAGHVKTSIMAYNLKIHTNVYYNWKNLNIMWKRNNPGPASLYFSRELGQK